MASELATAEAEPLTKDSASFPLSPLRAPGQLQPLAGVHGAATVQVSHQTQ